MSDAHGHDTDGHGHGSRFIQHHYDDAQHQFDSGKLGVWLFLAQEVLFFSGLFVAYVILRAQHPEIFEYASQYLDTTMGAINTVVLIGSSFTAAYAVRAAQLGQRKALVFCLAFTLLCACAFLTVKYFEYSHKGHIGALYGKKFNPTEDPHGVAFPKEGEAAPMTIGPQGENAEPEAAPARTNMFFTIYFAMTGLHGIHVLAGVIIFIWLLWRAIRGDFTSDYYGPIDYAALYWHLVDLIWIFLFPLFYLI